MLITGGRLDSLPDSKPVLIVVGGYRGPAEGVLRAELSRLHSGSTILTGYCEGVDRATAKIARSLGLCVRQVAADWRRFGASAWQVRNADFIKAGPDAVLAVHPEIQSAQGTLDLVRRADAAGCPVRLIEVGLC